MTGSTSTVEEPSLPIPMLVINDRSQRLTKQPLNPIKFTDLAEQERLVQEVLTQSQALRVSL